jgi:hypothetical protein
MPDLADPQERLVIKISLMRDTLFHTKVWLIRKRECPDRALHGSSNMTHKGIRRNSPAAAMRRA